jgi:hypothetical protein
VQSPLWIAAGAGGKVATSTNGLNWTITPQVAPASTTFSSVKNNNLPGPNNRWVAVANGAQVYVSYTGTSWIYLADLGSTDLLDVAYNGKDIQDGKWIIVGKNGKAWSANQNMLSQNDYTPLTMNMGSISNIQTIEHTNTATGELWMAAGESGKVRYSTDGVTWTNGPTSFGSNTIYDAVFYTQP